MRRNRRTMRSLLLAGLLCFVTGLAWVGWKPHIRIASGSMEISAPETWAGCVIEAARLSGVDRALFHAIVGVESGHHPYAFGWTDVAGIRHAYKAPTYADALLQFSRLEREHVTFDLGAAQINSRNFKSLQARTGVAAVHGLDPCTNLYFAGLILREQIRVHGATWKAVGGYNGAPAYADRVFRRYCREAQDDLCAQQPPLSDLLCQPLPGDGPLVRRID